MGTDLGGPGWQPGSATDEGTIRWLLGTAARCQLCGGVEPKAVTIEIPTAEGASTFLCAAHASLLGRQSTEFRPAV